MATAVAPGGRWRTHFYAGTRQSRSTAHGLTAAANTITEECPDCPDINGDGEVGVDEVLAVIAAWDTNNTDADVNADGIVDTNDLLLVLSAWGPCP